MDEYEPGFRASRVERPSKMQPRVRYSPEYLEQQHQQGICDRHDRELLDLQQQLNQTSNKSSATREEVQDKLDEDNLRRKELEENRARQENQRVQIGKDIAQLMLTSNELSEKLKSLDQDTNGVDIESECEMLTITHIYMSNCIYTVHYASTAP